MFFFHSSINCTFNIICRSYPASSGQPLQALKKTNVKIVEEELNIILTLDQMKVRAVFQFKNPGGQTSFPVGLPCEPVIAGMAGINCSISPESYHTGQRGRSVPKSKLSLNTGRC